MVTAPEHLATLMRDNPIFKQMQTVEVLAEGIASGNGRSRILVGPPGIGKNFIFERAFRRHNIRVEDVTAQPHSGAGFVRVLKKLKKKGKILYIDEADFIFSNEPLCLLLKSATDHTKGERWITHDLKDEGGPFKIEGAVVMLTNKNLRDLSLFKTSLHDSIAAINSRCLPFYISGSPEEIWYYACYLALCQGSLRRFTLATANRALEYFATKAWLLSEISPRMLTQIAEQIKTSPDVWDSLMEQNLRSKPIIAGKPPKPFIIDPVEIRAWQEAQKAQPQS